MKLQWIDQNQSLQILHMGIPVFLCVIYVLLAEIPWGGDPVPNFDFPREWPSTSQTSIAQMEGGIKDFQFLWDWLYRGHVGISLEMVVDCLSTSKPSIYHSVNILTSRDENHHNDSRRRCGAFILFRACVLAKRVEVKALGCCRQMKSP